MDETARGLIEHYLDPMKQPLTAILSNLLLKLPFTSKIQEPKSVFTCYDLGFNFVQALQVLSPPPSYCCMGPMLLHCCN